MRPGEIVPGDGATPTASSSRRERVTVRNRGRFPAYVGSHFALERVSASLELDRAFVEGARPDLPAGTTIRIGPGESTDLGVVWD